MRAIVFAMALITSEAMALEFPPEQRPIANAVWLLKMTGVTFNSQLKVLSPERAVLLEKNEGPALIQKTDRCTYDLRHKGFVGISINFSLVSDQYTRQCSAFRCGLTVLTAPGAVCQLYNDGRRQCHANIEYPSVPDDTVDTLFASMRVIFEDGCGPYQPPAAKPRF